MSTPLDDLVASGYSAQVLKSGPMSVALDAAALAFVMTPGLLDEATTELGRLNDLSKSCGSNEAMERRCYISARRREFLAAAIAHPAPDAQAIAAAQAAAVPQPPVIPIGAIDG